MGDDMTGRTNQILEMLTEENRIEVSVLADRLGVSQVTVRKDLDALEQRQIIRREHGFAVLRSTDDINGRLARHYEEKRKIAEKAIELIHDGDTIMIESGSCCAILADLVTTHRKNITIITNSAFISDYVRGRSGVQVILLGGIYQQEAQVCVGPLVRQCVENFFVNLFFIGTDGCSSRTGFTNSDQMRAQAVRDMALQAEHVIVLTESEKFGRHGIVPLNLKARIDTVITDSLIPEDALVYLSEQEVRVIKA